MKFRWDKKYLYWGLTAFTVLIACIGVIYLLFNGFNFKTNIERLISIFMPIIDGLVIAYLMAPLVNLFERRLVYPIYKKQNITISNKLIGRTRLLSILVTFIVVFAMLYSFFQFVVPQVYNSIVSIIGQLPAYINNVSLALDEFFHHNPEMENYVAELFDRFSNMNQSLLSSLNEIMNEMIRTFSQSVISVFRELLNLIVGVVVSIYLLFSKEKFIAQSKKIIYAVFERSTANNIISDLKMINRTFGGFISGKILDSLIIGILCYFCISIIGTPYPLLISVIVGVTNVIPYFGSKETISGFSRLFISETARKLPTYTQIQQQIRKIFMSLFSFSLKVFFFSSTTEYITHPAAMITDIHSTAISLFSVKKSYIFYLLQLCSIFLCIAFVQISEKVPATLLMKEFCAFLASLAAVVTVSDFI